MWNLLLALVLMSSQALTIEKVEFAESVEVQGQKLKLNGAGLRTKRKLGMEWRVYVAALYLKEKSKDAASIISSSEPKQLELVFLRSVDKKTLQEAWEEGFAKNCQSWCEKGRSGLAQFNSLMKDVKDGTHLKLLFEEKGVFIDGAGTIEGKEFSQALMAIFVGTEPPTAVLKKGLLGTP